jgi:hypothetical protein
MALGYIPGGRLARRWSRTSGVIFAPNSQGVPVAAPVEARLAVEKPPLGVDLLAEEHRDVFHRLGTFPPEEIRDLLPEPEFSALYERSVGQVVFEAD